MVERADELGMAVNLYDDFNWSSGQCGGRVTADRHLCALGIAMNSARVSGNGTEVVFESSPAVSAAAIRRAEQRFRRCTALRLSSFILKSSFSLFTLFDRKSVHVIVLPVP